MISVRNRLQRLSGSKLIVCVLLSLMITGCGIFSPSKPVVKKKPKKERKTVPRIDHSKKDEKKDTTTENENDPKDVKDSTSDPKESEIDISKTWNVSMFLPIDAPKVSMGALNVSELHNLEFIQYYAGVKLALEDLEKEGATLSLSVFDANGNSSDFAQTLKNQLPLNTDLVMGPFDKGSLQVLADFGKRNEIPVISPWLSSRSVTEDNPYFIQFRPFLIEHFNEITKHALSQFDASQIYVAARNNSKELGRIKYFQEAAFNLTKVENPLQIISFEEQALYEEEPLFERIIHGEQDIAIIIPNYASKDANYIYNLLRRINVEKRNRQVVVYTMPITMSMDKMSYNFYTSMKIRTCVSRFVDKYDNQVKAFEARYFNVYNDLPASAAFEGYDNMLYVGRQLMKNGKSFYLKSEPSENAYFSTLYRMVPMYDNKDDQSPKVKYYENNNLQIVEYQSDRFVRISK